MDTSLADGPICSRCGSILQPLRNREEGGGQRGARPPGTPKQLFSAPPCVKSHAPNLSASTSSASSANAQTIKELISRWVGRGCGPEADGTHQYSLPPPLQAPHCPCNPRLLPCFLFSGPNAPLTLLPHFSAILALSPTPAPLYCPLLCPIPLSNLSLPPLAPSTTSYPIPLLSHPSHCLLHLLGAHPFLLPMLFPHPPLILVPLLSTSLLLLPLFPLPFQHECGAQKVCLVHRFMGVGLHICYRGQKVA